MVQVKQTPNAYPSAILLTRLGILCTLPSPTLSTLAFLDVQCDIGSYQIIILWSVHTGTQSRQCTWTLRNTTCPAKSKVLPL